MRLKKVTSASHAHTYRGVHVKKGKRLPNIDDRTVACIDCEAKVGEECVSLTTGNPLGRGHVARHRLAARKYWAEREEQEQKVKEL